jgi:ABC-type multidrug transport system ATPase subunit
MISNKIIAKEFLMELVYLWVDKYKNIEKQGFNFSPRFRCEYDEKTNELTIDENKDYVSIFPDNINITAIVGENGSGKSTILEYISGSFNESVQYQTITISFSDNEIFIEYYHFAYQSTIQNSTLYKHKEKSFLPKTTEESIKTFPRFETFNNHTLVYYALSPFDRCNIWKDYNNFKYLGLLNKDRTFNQNTFLPTMIESIVDFCKTSQSDYLSSFNIEIPNEIIFMIDELNNRTIEVFHKKQNLIDAIVDFFDIDEIEKESLRQLTKKQYQLNRREMNKGDKSFLSNFLLIHFWLETMQGLLSNTLSKAIYSEQIEKFTNSIQKTKNLIDSLKLFFSVSTMEVAQTHPNKIIYEFIKKFTEIAEVILINDPKPVGELHIHTHLLVHFKDIDEEFIQLFKKVRFQNPFEFWWRQNGAFIKMSSGEFTMLHLASKLHYVSQSSNLQENIFFMFDEIEVFLHPEWQRRYFYDLIKLITMMFADKKVHVVITSHSPFILSDIPTQHIIFLKEGKIINNEVNINTFGANIHTLLSHGFFMKNGLMGEFAKDKIQSIIEYHEELLKKELTKNENKKQRDEEKEIYEKEHKTKFWQIQSIIGDDYLKQVIKNHLVEIEKILYDEYLIDKEIEKLQDKIDRLKRLKK